MPAIRPDELPAGLPTSTSVTIIDTGSTVIKATPGALADVARPYATEMDGLTGTDNQKVMTPLRVAQTLEAQPVVKFVDSIDALKAAPTDKPSRYDGSNFDFKLGNYTGQADDLNVIKADSIPLSTGAWVRQQSDGITSKRTGATSGYQSTTERLDRTPIDIAEYVKTSATDQTLAIERAINDSSILGRPLVCTESLSLQSVLIPNGTIIRAGRPGQVFTIIDDGTAQGQQFVLDGVEGVRFGGVSITSTATARTGVYGNVMIINGSEDIQFEDVDFGKSSSAALWTGGNSKNIKVIRCRVHDTFADGLHFTRGCSDITVFDCDLWNCGDDAIAFVGYLKEGLADRPHMTNCRALFNRIRGGAALGSGVVFLGVDGGWAVGNAITSTARNGISVVYEIDEAVATHYCRNITLSKNNIAAVSTSGSGRGISIDTARNVTLDDNLVDGGYEHALGLFGVVVDIEIRGGSYGGQSFGSNIAHVSTPTTNARVINELFTFFGETVAEAVSRGIRSTAKLVKPTQQPTVNIAGQSGKMLRSINIDGSVAVARGGGANGTNLSFCERPRVSAEHVPGPGTGARSTGIAVNLGACTRPEIFDAKNLGAADAGAVLVSGTTDYSISRFDSEGAVIGVLAENAANGIIANSWLRNNSSGARINTGPTVKLDNNWE